VVGRDPATDLAVLKIKSDKKFPAVSLGDSDKLRIGSWVVAIGSPFGLEQTVTCGIVSAIRQKVILENTAYENMIQTDAAINRGNSGGPLLNLNGEVVGINTAIYAPTGVFSGIGFAIPINLAKNILEEMIDKGKVTRGWLGVYIQDVDRAIALQFGLKEQKGALVNKVEPGSPADKAGIERGDIIIEIDGKEVKNTFSLRRLVSEAKPGQTVRLKIVRGRKYVEAAVRITEMQGEESRGARGRIEKEETDGEAEWEGIRVSELSEDIRSVFDIKSGVRGVVVIGVDPGSLAGEAGLMRGDVLQGINQNSVSGIEDFRKAAKKIDLSSGVVFDIIRRGEPLYITIIGE
ncbi:MAG TPA: PDZ domain-containing protein, partial [bacterium]|nr:PDZ domain-containing protein [bacterium]